MNSPRLRRNSTCVDLFNISTRDACCDGYINILDPTINSHKKQNNNYEKPWRSERLNHRETRFVDRYINARKILELNLEQIINDE